MARLAPTLMLAVLLAACSSGNQPSFDSKGLVAPPANCPVNPKKIAYAERIRDVDGPGACEIEDAWRVRGLTNVSFSQPAILGCNMVDPLNDWMQNTVQPAAMRSFGESVASVDVAASYSCRGRNNKRGARMSEHGFGNAIDIAAFTLESGRKVSVQTGRRDEKAFVRIVREEACGNFMTVLGPGSDRAHKDHIHLDLQNRRSGQRYCH